MTPEEAKDLLEKYQKGFCTSEEKTRLASWYDQLIGESDLGLTAEKKDRYYIQMLNSINSGIAEQERKPVKLWPRIGIAAAVAAIVFGIWLFEIAPWPFHQGRSNSSLQVQRGNLNDLPPGKQGATLTLANGKRIHLTDAIEGELVNEGGVKVSKSADGQLVYEMREGQRKPGSASQINTLSTANGEMYLLILPDKSKVWLNSASSLTYSTRLLTKGLRRVKLTGEAYFEISKDKAHPFIVDSRGQQVEVLGTHFNVNAYSDEPAVSTTLLEGSVKVSSGKKHQVLQPGFRSITQNGSISTTIANTEATTDWKDGDFNLEGLAFKVAMRKIARWYDVEVIYDQAVSDNIMSGGWISRDTKLSTILEVIERSGLVHFRLEGKKLYVSK